MKSIVKIAQLNLPGEWISKNLFLPSILAGEMTPEWRRIATSLADAFPDGNWIISSIKSDYTGRIRSGKSHPGGYALDLAPMFSRDNVLTPDSKSPRLADNRPLLTFLAKAAVKRALPGIAVEGDHFHIDTRLPKGTAWAYSTYRPTYSNDVANNLVNSTLDKKFFKVGADGSMIPVSVTAALASKIDARRPVPVSTAFVVQQGAPVSSGAARVAAK